MMRDHGGDLDRARARFGAGDWIDLSTGINPVPYPVPDLPPRAWAALPTREDLAKLAAAARAAYGTTHDPVPLAGAQAAIQIVPHLAPPGDARVLGPTYNEHGAALETAGWRVAEVTDPNDLAGADLAVLVSPNNPDGRRVATGDLIGLAGRVGYLVVDESFADAMPSGSLAGETPLPGNLVVLRSFGKFYGLAGLRLGFAIAASGLAERIRRLAGPWAVSGPAIAIGSAALADTAWQTETRSRLASDAARLDLLAQEAGWPLVGGTPLFRTYDTGNAAEAQARLAGAHIWTRIFPYSKGWIRLGLPGDSTGWVRLEAVLTAG